MNYKDIFEVNEVMRVRQLKQIYYSFRERHETETSRHPKAVSAMSHNVKHVS